MDKFTSSLFELVYPAGAVFCIGAACFLLALLSIIDLRTFLLPNKYVLPFALAGFGFNFFTHYFWTGPIDMLAGAGVGGGLLYAIYITAALFGQKDALGLGDVKLLAAAGVWLGPHDVIVALLAGATAGIVHGLALAAYRRYRTGQPVDLRTLSLPAGPGFALGILIAGLLKFTPFLYL